MSGNGMSVDMPPCYTKEDYGEMCRHKGKKVCAEYNGCSLCYCTDHEYKGKQKVLFRKYFKKSKTKYFC